MCNMLLDEFFIQYHASSQIEMVQFLGQRTESKFGNDDVVMDVKEAIKQASFNKSMKSGFSYVGSSITTSSAKKAHKRSNYIDFKPFRDPTNPAYVPTGWCIWYFRLGSCKKGTKCPHKHSMWTDADLESAKKK